MLAEWEAFYNLQPFGPMRDNFHAAQNTHVIAAALGSEVDMESLFYVDSKTRELKNIAERKAKDERVIEFFRGMIENG